MTFALQLAATFDAFDHWHRPPRFGLPDCGWSVGAPHGKPIPISATVQPVQSLYRPLTGPP